MISVVGQSEVLTPLEPTTGGVGPLTFPTGVKPKDVLFAAEFLGGYAVTRDGWNPYDTVPGPDPWPNNPANNKWTYPPTPTLDMANGVNPADWMNGYGAFWHPFKIYSGLETPSSRPCERKEIRGWYPQYPNNTSTPYYGYAGLWVCGALRGVDNVHPLAWGARLNNSYGAKTTLPSGLQYYPCTFPLGVTVPGAAGKRGLWIFACEWNGAQEILNNLRPLTWGNFDGQVTYETLYFGTSWLTDNANYPSFHRSAEGREFSHATGVAILTSPLPSDVIPPCTWALRCVTSDGVVSTTAGPFGTLILLNDAPLSAALDQTGAISGNIGAGQSVSISADGSLVDGVTYPDASTFLLPSSAVPAGSTVVITSDAGETATVVTPLPSVTISPAAGIYTSPQTVTIAPANFSGGFILYTLDGSDPTEHLSTDNGRAVFDNGQLVFDGGTVQ
ncbi:chitobiase/beta-hexosaminidase C-terminal domain-containing protein [Geomonas nitrogeniifigens]|uniref:chitobiase/beta-hexosaminidase C-terminal domain-containing protein n=1 Tax=Geomonas diazotrophica TaxID=2843197 RepID=UPI001C2CB73D|nr:chitobiase/beta-hexosaminidase C-terminal domain-containing protein [Geomonas nitrogeniifigens]QXE85958.1 chitobiase/beta-hexosaminidase C-terminal domain-containing protein [Geomonas nitrogeniifigens]